MIFLTNDNGLLKHWQRTIGAKSTASHATFSALEASASRGELVWIDSNVKDLPDWNSPKWKTLIHTRELRIILTSSAPRDEEAIPALDAGCAGYCQAFADASILANVKETVETGQIWVGASLLQRLIKVANHVSKTATLTPSAWKEGLSAREVEVAELAASGASNQQIADICRISERTVKAHLSSIFLKMNVTDRLQMTLRVHGIS